METRIIRYPSPNGQLWEIIDTLGIDWESDLFELLDSLRSGARFPFVDISERQARNWHVSALFNEHGTFDCRLRYFKLCAKGRVVGSGSVVIKADFDDEVYKAMVVAG